MVLGFVVVVAIFAVVWEVVDPQTIKAVDIGKQVVGMTLCFSHHRMPTLARALVLLPPSQPVASFFR